MTGQPAASGYRAGRLAIVGRPNVGKSTLLNRMLGQKLSITSQRPQTTRDNLLGILTRPDAQFVFVDTPGLQPLHTRGTMRALNRLVRHGIDEADVVLVLVEASGLERADEAVLRALPERVPVIAVVNKIDRLADKPRLLPLIDALRARREFAAIVPVSAGQGTQVDALLDAAARLLPEQPALYPADAITDRDERWFAAELIREKLMRTLGDELPYDCRVEIERFGQEGRLRRIAAAIVVGKEGRKPIVIGSGGERLKAIGSAARRDMETLFGGPVFLELWVKVRAQRSRKAATGG